MNRRRVFLLALLFPLAALAVPGNVVYHLDEAVTFTDCAAGGSSAQTLRPGTYAVEIFDADTNVCISASASTCVSGGVKLGRGKLARPFKLNASRSISCRSSASSGDVVFIPITQ